MSFWCYYCSFGVLLSFWSCPEGIGQGRTSCVHQDQYSNEQWAHSVRCFEREKVSIAVIIGGPGQHTNQIFSIGYNTIDCPQHNQNTHGRSDGTLTFHQN